MTTGGNSPAPGLSGVEGLLVGHYVTARLVTYPESKKGLGFVCLSVSEALSSYTSFVVV
jgi:hypothetical protein